MTDSILLGSAMTQNLLAIKRASRLVDITTQRLATGLNVSTALDNPQNFFTAQGFNDRASDLTRRLDGIGKGIQTIKQGLNGAETLEELLRLSEGTVVEELERFRESGPLPAPPSITQTVTVTVPAAPLDAEILADNPGGYWRLNEVAGAVASNLGSIGIGVDGAYTNGPTLNAAPLFAGAGPSVDFDGTNQFIAIPDSAQINTTPQTQRSVELVFNADDTTGRQVLYEEGGGTNALTIYIFNGDLYISGRDSGAWGPANISAPIVAGQTYHAAFTLDSVAGEFIGYLDGVEIGRDTVTATFPSHSGNIGIGAMNNSAYFHDGPQGGNGFYFNGRISDVALYNATLSPIDIVERALSVAGTTTTTTTATITPPIELEDLEKTLDQINQLTLDASYLGINLLGGDDLTTLFNEDGSNKLLTEGVEFTAEGLGVQRIGFETEDGILAVLESIRSAIKDVRDYSRTLTSDLGILQTREDFTRSTINTLLAGADDLTLGDINKEGANLLALQTRQTLATTALSLASQSNQSILDIFG